MISLQSRLNISLGLSLVLIFVIIGLLANSVINNLTESLILSRLEHDGESLISALNFDPQNRATLSGDKLNAVYQRAYSGHYYHIELADGRQLRSRSLWDHNLQARPLALGTEESWHSTGPAGQQLLIWSGRFNKQGRDFTLLVAEDLTPIQQSLNHFTAWFAALTLFSLVSLLLIQRLIVRNGFKPIKQLSRELQHLEQGQIQHLSTQASSEVQPLVDEVNHLISLLRQQLERYRSSTGNLAHALKTPLTLLRQMSEQQQLRQHPELCAELRAQTDTIGHLLERELTRARLAGSASPGRRFEPDEELPALRKLLLRIHPHKALELDFRYPPGAHLPVERDDMLELLGNLLDNACKWAYARVRLCIESDNGLYLRVEDDGPGCSEEQLASLTTSGLRLDESKEGHGLGLSIVREIVNSYHGQITLGRSPELGGLQVEIRLPTASSLKPGATR